MGISTTDATGSAVELELELWDRDCFFVDASAVAGCRVELEHMVHRSDGRLLEYFTVAGAPPDRVIARSVSAEGGVGDDHDEAFLEGMKTPLASEEGVTSPVRNTSATNTSHTTEVNPGDVTVDTLLLWGTEDEFQPVELAERLEDDIDSRELIGLEANHWVPEDRTEAFTEHLTDCLL